MVVALSPFGFGSEAELLGFLQRPAIADDIAAAANKALGVMHTHTGRNLAARTYRNAVDVSPCETTNGDKTVGVGGDISLIRVLDEVVGAGMAEGSRVASLDAPLSLELDRNATATATGVTLTFGSEPLIAAGADTDVLQAPEFPVHEVWAIRRRLDDGTTEAVDITGLRIDRATGRLLLPGTLWTEGDGNYEIDCLAGYRTPSGLARGDREDVDALKGAYHRLAQAIYQDQQGAKGRKVTTALNPSSVTIEGFRMPDDVKDVLDRYVRLWG